MSNILWDMGQIVRCGAVYRTSRLPEDTPPPVHHNLLITICDRPGLSQDRLARQMCLNKSTITRRLSYLEENGYVLRTPSESDKRVLLVTPTEKAYALLPRIKALTEEWSCTVTEELSEEELQALESMLSRLAARARILAEISGGDEE